MLQNSFGKAYRESCGHRAVGLYYEDLFIETKPVQEVGKDKQRKRQRSHSLLLVDVGLEAAP